jgi:magnesium-transporting ATPase (P-type)
MSCVVEYEGELKGYIKGSPEILRKISVSFPNNFDEVLTGLAKKGYRVLGIGCKELDKKILDKENGVM